MGTERRRYPDKPRREQLRRWSKNAVSGNGSCSGADAGAGGETLATSLSYGDEGGGFPR
jgi:hypothetical protein